MELRGGLDDVEVDVPCGLCGCDAEQPSVRQVLLGGGDVPE